MRIEEYTAKALFELLNELIANDDGETVED